MPLSVVHGRRDPDHLRRGDPRRPADRRELQARSGTTGSRSTSATRAGSTCSLEALLIIVMTYFYTSVVFNPVDQADNLRKYNGYIPGIRPGPPTAAYFDRVLNRLTLPGRALPRGRRRRAVDLHRALPLLAGDLPRPRRHVGPHRRRRGAPDDATDGVADGHAPLRRVPTLNILVLGPQGSGKGTQAQRITAMYGIPHIATGDMIREMRELPTPVGSRAEGGLRPRRPRLRRPDDPPDPRPALARRHRRRVRPRRLPAHDAPGRGARRRSCGARTRTRRRLRLPGAGPRGAPAAAARPGSGGGPLRRHAGGDRAAPRALRARDRAARRVLPLEPEQRRRHPRRPHRRRGLPRDRAVARGSSAPPHGRG